MAKTVQWRGGTAAEHASFTGAVREVTVETDTGALRVHDGSTAGGTRIAPEAEIKSWANTQLEGKAASEHTHTAEDVSGVVTLTGNQSINGTKTFGSSPVIPSPTADTHAANKAYVDEAMGNVQGCPTGMIAFFHATTPPDGWLPCNGQNVSRTTYANLFSVIGTTYGSGDGSTTFALPNLHHRFLEGTTTASEVGDYVEAGLPNISGNSGSLGGMTADPESNGCLYFERARYTMTGGDYTQKTIYIDASRSSAIYGGSSSVQPSSLHLIPCLKA